MMDREWIRNWVHKRKAYFRRISRTVWEYAELGLREEKSAALLCSALREHGFEVQTGLAGISTAFSGSFGSGGPVIGILGEFDALEGLSQEAGGLQRQKRLGNDNGHGCGHNLLGTAALAAALALKDYMEETGLGGTIVYFGCPGEEYGCGKTYMAREGCFAAVDAALTWHPMDENRVEERGSLAALGMEFIFTGKSAHASVCPHLGRSALDAVELLNVASNFMREHIIPEARIHYAITDAGGTAPNIIPAKAKVAYEVRAPRMKQAVELRERIVKAAQGAALMTETQMEMEFGDGYSDFVPNDVLNRVMWETLTQDGGPVFSEEERKLAARFRMTFSGRMDEDGDEDDDSVINRLAQDSLSGRIIPYTGPGGCMTASTDVGDVSYVVPAAQLYITCCAAGTPSHSWQMTAQTGSSIGETGMLAAARVLALTAAELFRQPDLVRQAKEEHRKMAGPYVCPIPRERKPDIRDGAAE